MAETNLGLIALLNQSHYCLLLLESELSPLSYFVLHNSPDSIALWLQLQFGYVFDRRLLQRFDLFSDWRGWYFELRILLWAWVFFKWVEVLIILFKLKLIPLCFFDFGHFLDWRSSQKTIFDAILLLWDELLEGRNKGWGLNFVPESLSCTWSLLWSKHHLYVVNSLFDGGKLHLNLLPENRGEVTDLFLPKQDLLLLLLTLGSRSGLALPTTLQGQYFCHANHFVFHHSPVSLDVLPLDLTINKQLYIKLIPYQFNK